MNSKTRIIVIKLKELLITSLIVIMAIALIIFLIIAFSNKSTKSTGVASSGRYIPGVYSSQIILGGNPIDIQITVDSDNINDISLVNVSQSITTMYPLFESSFNEIAAQVCSSGSTKNITYPSENQYTSSILLKAIENTLTKCSVQ